MKNVVIKNVALFLILSFAFTMTIGCSNNYAISMEEAYNIYYDTIQKFVPELMTQPQECDIDIKTRDEVTFLNEHFVRNTTVKIQSQNTDGKLQYYLLNKFPEANKMNFYCIDNNKFYATSSSKMNGKGNLVEWSSLHIPSFLFAYLNTPFFEQDAITSFTSKRKSSDVELTFVIDGSNMEYGYPQRVMIEINPRLEDELDDVKIILTIDKDGIPKTMSTEISMTILNDDGSLYAKKKLNMDFVFNALDTVDFDLQGVLSQYALDPSVVK
ncbi:MAG: hypothetical protein E7521_09420 [Ruminococcaceae bacterium]|nr:hypothetical protein [Oscillospiraceae bacterium]